MPKYRVADVLVDSEAGSVEVPGQETVRLEPKVMGVLDVLLETPGRIWSKQDLIDQVWAGRFVGDDVVYRAVGRLRQLFPPAVGTIETLPRRGYRWLGEVAVERSEGAAAADRPAPSEDSADLASDTEPAQPKGPGVLSMPAQPSRSRGWRRSLVGRGLAGAAALLGLFALWGRGDSGPVEGPTPQAPAVVGEVPTTTDGRTVTVLRRPADGEGVEQEMAVDLVLTRNADDGTPDVVQILTSLPDGTEVPAADWGTDPRNDLQWLLANLPEPDEMATIEVEDKIFYRQPTEGPETTPLPPTTTVPAETVPDPATAR